MPTGVNTLAEPLTNELLRREVLPAAEAVEIVQQLAREIAQRHESGRLHLRIAVETVSYNSDTGRAELGEPLHEASSFGGAESDDEFCPPELQQARSVLMAVDLSAARAALQLAGLAAVDPRRVDIYQLGTLLCRLLTGQSVNAFLSRPRVAAKVPPEARDLIERMLGHDPQRAIRSAEELLRALETLDAARTQALLNAQPGSTRNVSKPDTTPSFVSMDAADTDAGRPAPSPVDEAALPFQKLGHYEIVGRLGRGGMGDVYKGYERRLDRYVAIKVLPQEFSRQDEMVKRFNAEASAAAKLVHPNTVEIYFIGENEIPTGEGQPPATVHFFAMQYVEGESLADLLARRKRLNVEETLSITEQVLAGLDAAHQLGMVHRDIKPGNILIDRQRQRVQLADFGLVKSLQGSGMTASGVIVGTADYMAPEQGRGGHVDARADLYAVGVVLFQILSGRLPFKADSVTAMIFQHVYEPPPPLHEVANDVPEALAAIIAKLLSKSPDARYQNAAALLADLRAFHRGQSLPSGVDRIGVLVSTGTRRASQPDEVAAVDPTARPRTVIIPAPRFADEAVLPVTLTQLATPDRWQRYRQAIRDFLLLQSEEFVREIQTTEQHVDAAIANYEQRHSALADAIRDANSVVKELKSQQDLWRRANAEAEQRAARAPDDDTARVALGEKLRGERVLAELSEQFESQQTQLDEMRRKQSQITATLERLHSQRDVLNARLKVARAQIRMSGGVSGGVGDESFARRAKLLMHRLRWLNVSLLVLVLMVLIGATTILFKVAVFGLRGDVGLAEIEKAPLAVKVEEALESASTMAELFRNPPNTFGQPFSGGGSQKQVVSLAVSSTGKHVATATGERAVFLWDAESGQLVRRLSENLREVNVVAFSHDGKILITGETTGEMSLKLWDVDTGELLGGLPEERNSIYRLAVSPAGPFVAISEPSGRDHLVIWNYETRTRHWSTNAKETPAKLAFSPDGILLVGMSGRGEVCVWDLGERKLRASWIISFGTSVYKLGPLFLPSGTELLTNYSGDSIAKWDARTGKLLSQTPGGLLANVSSLSLSKDGRWLAASSQSWVTIVDSQSGLLRAAMPGHQTTATAFSPQGDKLFSAGGSPFLVRWATNSPVLTGRGWSREVIASPPFAVAALKPLSLIREGTQLGIWNFESQSPLVRLKSNSPIAVEKAAAAFSSDALRAVVLDGAGNLQFWDLVTDKHRNIGRIPDSAVQTATYRLTFSPDGEVVWVSADTRLWRVDLQRNSVESWLEWPLGTERTALSADGRFAIAAAADIRSQEWQVWDIAKRQPLIPNDKTSESFHSFAFARDGHRLLALDTNGGFHLWDLEQTKLLDRFEVNRAQQFWNSQLAFLPGDRHVVAYSHPTMRVIDVERHEEVLNFEAPQMEKMPTGENASPRGVEYFLRITPDGRYAVTAGANQDRLAFWSLYPQHQLGRVAPPSSRNQP